ncbi:centromere-associated protein E isoform 2-T2 [Spinachia spinachia]
MAEESAVKVCVRVRPLIAREESAAAEGAEPVPLFWKADKKSIQQIDDGNPTKSFVFDRVFTAEETTNQLYQDIAKPLVVSTVKGYNGTIFAYGQTSSGKTFTMMGGDRIQGVIPLAVDEVFQTIRSCSKKEFLLRVSYMEIYNETVSDLLVDSRKRKPLEVRETINKNIYVADLTEELVTSTAQVLGWIRKGEENRHYAKTKMNERSSRSHTIFRMILESREISEPASGEIADGAVIVSHLNLVDLAGSERASQTGAEGTHFKEGCNINRSLFTLGQVIKKLTDESQKGFTNYRDSKLTRILQNSLGGNAKTVIICTITPAALDETLSTLQFASTAKKMKNDPHVTEVSDDGALLKRYRNEIVDLKRRLHEVSSHTHTSATEKEVLSQLLQEKDQLQREQQDRIKNLTTLLVSSSNLVPVRKRPKRRVTWGGKMARLSTHNGPFDLSSGEAFARKTKADRSCMSSLCEEEDFDSHWEIADEPSYEMDMSQSSVTVRSFGDSPKESPSGIYNLSGKVSNLEMQLELETRHKEEATTKVETLEGAVAELQLQLQEEARQKQEALQKMQTAEQRAGEVELQFQLQAEAQQKQEANETVEMLNLRVAHLERQLEEQSHTQSEAYEQMRKEFSETIQLCETLAKEKDEVTAERRYLKEEHEMCMEEITRLEEEKATLSKEVEEKRELAEFHSLEEEFRKEHENELRNEISKLKSGLESSELTHLKLTTQLETLSKELQNKSEFAEELQSMSGKDLVKEVAALRRSLDDAEGLSRDTKKEWAHLRSKNMAVEEMNVNLNAGYEKMDAEVTRLRSQLEAEKSRYRAMQSDLQKELNVAFNENTKLTALLDGNVPKNLMDSLELERTAARLSRELSSSRDAEASFRAQLDELTQELQRVQAEKDALLSQQRSSAEETEKLLSSVTCLTGDLRGQVEAMQSLSEELQRVQAEKDALLSQQRSSAEEVTSLTAERDQLQTDLQENVEMMIENQEELRTALGKNLKQKEQIKLLEAAHASEQEDAQREQLQTLMIENQEELRASHEKIRLLQGEIDELRSQKAEPDAEVQVDLRVQRLSEKLQLVEAERDVLLSEKDSILRTSREETETLLGAVTSLGQERDRLQETVEGARREEKQLRAQMEDQMEALQTEREELRSLAEQENQMGGDLHSDSEMFQTEASRSLLQSLHQKTHELMQAKLEQETLKEQKAQLEQQVAQTQSLISSLQEELGERGESVSDQQSLVEQLERVRAERDALSLQMSAGHTSTQEAEKLLCTVASLSEERDQLLESLEAVRGEKQQLRAELEDRMETVQCELLQLGAEPQSLKEEQDRCSAQQIQQLEEHLEKKEEELSQLKSDLQDNVELMIENQEELRTSHEKIRLLQGEIDELRSQKAEPDAEVQVDLRVQRLSEKLQLVEAERDVLLSEKDSILRTSREETETLLGAVTSLGQERDRLQETVEGARRDEKQLRAQMEDQMEALQTETRTLSEKLQLVEAERDSILRASREETETLLGAVTSLGQERDRLQETVEGARRDEKQLRAQMEDQMEALQTEQIAQLETSLQTVTEQKRALEEEQQHIVSVASSTQERVKSLQEELGAQKQRHSDLDQVNQEKERSLDQLVQRLSEKLQLVEAERDVLLSEKDSILRTSREETETLLGAVTSLGQERDRLQETVEGARREEKQLRAQMEDQMETMLRDANATISALREQLAALDQRSGGGEEEEEEEEKKKAAAAALRDSHAELQESFGRLQTFIDVFPKYKPCAPERLQLSDLPNPSMDAYGAVQRQMAQTLGDIKEQLLMRAQGYRSLLEKLVKTDLAVFEERRLQDSLLHRAGAPRRSLRDKDLGLGRLAELLEKRKLYLQKTSRVLRRLQANRDSYCSELSAEVAIRERFKEQMKALHATQPLNFAKLDGVLSGELEHRSAMARRRKATLQGITEEHGGLSEELKLLEAQADSRLGEEKSKSAALLQALERAPAKSEVNQQLALQLRQTEEEVAALRGQIKQLDEAQLKASSRVSNHKQATQLLQTELQDSRAQVEEKDGTIRTLEAQLRLSEAARFSHQLYDAGTLLLQENASPSAVELEELRAKLFQMEVERRSASDQHKLEIQRMSTVLKEKEESVRKLKETLRKSQQQGEDSLLQGEELHARLINPRGLVIQTSVVLEKTKLEEEVQRLRLKITELESLVSSHQEEIGKWKGRAIKLKAMSKVNPSNPTKRAPSVTSVTSDTSDFLGSPRKVLVTPRKVLDSPRKVLGSPRKVLDSPAASFLDYPKSSFFDGGGGSELLSRTCPKQFFDNSSLGTDPDAAADRKEDWWPQSPKQEEMCKTQ